MAALSIGCNLIDITKPLLDPILGAMCSVLHDLNEKAFSKYLKKKMRNMVSGYCYKKFNFS